MVDESLFLVLNSGSSSVKFTLFNHRLEKRLEGTAAELNTANAIITTSLSEPNHSTPLPNGNHEAAIHKVLELLVKSGLALDKIKAVGHRVVHGGETFSDSVLIDGSVLEGIQQCAELAPLHNPANLLGIEIMLQHFPEVPNIAVFDTAFHHTLPSRAYLYALPYSLYQELGIRRYGFHGTSHRYITQEAVKRLGLDTDNHQLLVAHLGNGCSAAAIRNGHSVDTTMGLTPLEGLMMGTRSGDVDPGVHQFLNHKKQWSIDKITSVLNKQSGLLGLSGETSDMKALWELASQGHSRAQLAIEVFCFKVARALGALAMSLTKIDALIFTGGIAEHQAQVREKIIAHLSLLGIKIHNEFNLNHGSKSNGIITADGSTKALVIPTDEEKMIAIDCIKLTAELNHA